MPNSASPICLSARLFLCAPRNHCDNPCIALEAHWPSSCPIVLGDALGRRASRDLCRPRARDSPGRVGGRHGECGCGGAWPEAPARSGAPGTRGGAGARTAVWADDREDAGAGVRGRGTPGGAGARPAGWVDDMGDAGAGVRCVPGGGGVCGPVPGTRARAGDSPGSAARGCSDGLLCGDAGDSRPGSPGGAALVH